MSAGSVLLLLFAESVCLLGLVVLSMAVDTLVVVVDLTVVTSERLTLWESS